MKCHIRPIRFEILFEFESLLPIRFVFDSNANGRFSGPYARSTYVNDLQRTEISLRNIVKLMYEHYLRRFYDFASELYPRNALRPS